MIQGQVAGGAARAAVHAVAHRDKPKFMRVTAAQLRTIVQRASPMFKEGAWPNGEASLLAAVVEQWLGDVVQEARRQLSEDSRLWVTAQVRTLFGFERRSVEAVASTLSIEPVWFVRIIDTLELSFLATESNAQ